MNRILRTSLAILTLAIAANIAIAWACAIWLSDARRAFYRDPAGGSITGAPAMWGTAASCERLVRPGLLSEQESWAMVAFEGLDDLITPEQARAMRRSDAVPLDALSETVHITTRRYQVGLPLRCMQWRTCELPLDVELPRGFEAPVGGLGAGLVGLDNFLGYVMLAQRDRRLPLTPLWPAFAINTAVYALALGSVTVFWPAVRRGIRRSRGLCPHCAYPVGVSPLCTECGRPVGAAGPGAPSDSRAPSAS